MLQFAGETHPGTKLPYNEDSIGWSASRRVWVLADGLGGQGNGDLASRIVRDTILKAANASDDSLVPAVMSAHAAIMEAVRSDRSRTGMASTVVVMTIRDDGCRIAWCGDSRAYLWRNESLTQITRDHSRLAALIDAGKITADDARGHPEQNKLLQALGGDGQPEPSETYISLKPGDWLLLCSDGLHDTLSDMEITAVFRRSETANLLSRNLIQAALERSAQDNVSVVTVRWRPPGPADIDQGATGEFR